MSEMIRISKEEYALQEAEAQKVLETMAPETVKELRELCCSEITDVKAYVEMQYKWSLEYLTKLGGKRRVNPARRAIVMYWLTQIASFFSTLFFKTPREILPTVGYPHGASDAVRKYDNIGDMLDGIQDLMTRTVWFYDNHITFFRDIRDSIERDDTRLIIFCRSCCSMNPESFPVPTRPDFTRTAILVYRNNIEFPQQLYDQVLKETKFTAWVDGLVRDVSDRYTKAVQAAGPQAEKQKRG